MIAWHCGSNAIISAPFKSHANKHRLLAYGTIMQLLKDLNMLVYLQKLDNEASTEYKRIIKSKWGLGYQFVPLRSHRINAAERAIRTFKAHFLSTLAVIAPIFPNKLWDLILPQTDLTLNLLSKSTLNPKISAWEYFQGLFDYNSTPLRPLGCPVMIHSKTYNHKSWDFIGK